MPTGNREDAHTICTFHSNARIMETMPHPSRPDVSRRKLHLDTIIVSGPTRPVRVITLYVWNTA
ncbi:hypothetical protein NEOLEDRAFT_1138153 [Neolentinus lepideus HHB14362 ss-1]|uniref:Uncharacterized protein n=1 Tax=Neolentinus lepideus HHB14362 ss-1 TaxID=1314782 RepID=A0A165QD64_9AGAM|nr:hypothetical protein NEOLEDRAFT_1138153 [Neolentinus lepideus HHB14362 ss-1]